MKKIRTIIEITDNDIRILQAKKVKDKTVIMFCDAHQAAGLSDEDTVRVIKRMVAELPAGSGEVTVVVPRRLVLLRPMQIPSHNHEEILDILGLQLVNNIPYPVEDVIYQYHLLEQDPEGYSRVLAVIIHREASRRYCLLMKEAGVKDIKLTFSSMGILEWMGHQSEASGSMDPPVAVLNMDVGHSELCFCQKGKLFFSRNLNYGEEHASEQDISALAGEVMRSLDIYRERSLGPAIKRMILLSSSEKGVRLKKHLNGALALPMEQMSPAKDMPSLHVPRSLNHSPASITVGLGLLFAEKSSPMNLAPREIYREKESRIQRLALVKFFVFLAMVSILGVSIQWMGLHKKELRLQSLEKARTRLEPQLKEAEAKKRVVEFFDQKQRQNAFIPDLVDELNQVTPKEISFRMLSLDKQGGLMIQGYAPTHAAINDFQAKMIESTWFYDVDLKFATKRRIANLPVMDFKIASRLGGEGKGEE